MREVLAHAAPLLEHLAQRGRDARRFLVEREILVDPLRQIERRFEHAPPADEALRGIVDDLAPRLDVRRFVEERGGLEQRRFLERVQAFVQDLPLHGRRGERRLLAWSDLDLGLGAHDELLVRRGEQHVHGRVAVVVRVLVELTCGRLDRDAMGQHALP